MPANQRFGRFASIARSHMVALALIAPASALVACGGQVLIEDGGDVGGASTTVGNGVTSTTTASPQPAPTTGSGESCSAETAYQGAPCFINNDQCTYGLGSCTLTFTCVGSTWQNTNQLCEQNPPDVCATAQWNQSCGTEGEVCPMETGCGPCSITCSNGVWATTPGQCVFEPTC